jgi:cytochrome c oxidase assembly factor CtaG
MIATLIVVLVVIVIRARCRRSRGGLSWCGGRTELQRVQ